MDNRVIENFIKENDRFEMPDFQERFEMSYSEASKTLDELCEKNSVKFCGGLTYEAVRQEVPIIQSVYVPQTEKEKFFIKALWECVKNGRASVTLVHRNCSCSFASASLAIDWMEENGYIGEFPDRKLKIGIQEYYEKFGDLESSPLESSMDKCLKDLNERRRAFYADTNRMSFFNDEDDDDDDEDGDDDDNEDDDSVDLTDARSRREFLEKRRQELNARMRKTLSADDEDDEEDNNDGDDNDDENVDHDVQDSAPIIFKPALIRCLEHRLQYRAEDKTFILRTGGESQFEFKVVNDDLQLKISDGGKTLAASSHTKRKIGNVLKGFTSVVLDGEDISVTVKDASDVFTALLTLYSAVDAVKKMK